MVNRTQVIDQMYWAAYSSINGNEFIDLQATDIQAVTTTGSVFELDSSNAKANTQLMVTYTYDTVPVPEPSTVIVQLLICAGGVGLFVVRRRRAAAVRA